MRKKDRPNQIDLVGGPGGDTLVGTNDADTLDGAGGNDILVGLGGVDTMIGGAGDDTFYVENAADATLEAPGEGNDRVATSVSFALAAGAEIERLEAVNFTAATAINLTGNAYSNILIGNAGVNVLDGGAGADVMSGGDGDDIYYVDDAGDVVNEEVGRGIDRIASSVSYVLAAQSVVESIEVLNQTSTNAIDLTGSDTANVIKGNHGANILRGGGGDDIIETLAGNDILIGGIGNDTMYGGAGDDTYYVDSSNDRAFEASGEGNDRVAASASFALNQDQHVEIIEAVNLSDTTAINLSGSSFANRIIGNAGANTLFGGGGDDTMIGLGGDDIIRGGFDADVMIGGTGNDTYVVWDSRTRVIELPGEGTDRLQARFDFILAADAEIEFLEIDSIQPAGIDLTGNGFAQTITGNASDNEINGGGGEDVLIGLGGDDRYFVDSAGDVVQETTGNDLISTSISYVLAAGLSVERLEPLTIGSTASINLTGNEIRNTITGNQGLNTLDGGGANDVLTGLGGADTFVFSTALGPNNIDTIVDLVSGSDRIALDDAVFAGLTPGILPAGAFVIGPAALDADDRIIYDSALRALFFDADGNGSGAAVQFATLSGNPAIVASDFTII